MLKTQHTQFGVSRKFGKDIEKYIRKLHENSVDYYEMGFTFGIPKNVNWDKIIKVAREANIGLSSHLPYFINLGNKEKIETSIKYLIRGLEIAHHFGSVSVFHVGYYGKRSFRELKSNIISTLEAVINEYGYKYPNGKLGVETTGKTAQIGTLEEVLDIIREVNSPPINSSYRLGSCVRKKLWKISSKNRRLSNNYN